MRNWLEHVRQNLDLDALPANRQRRITEELAEQLEDFYREALEKGDSPGEAHEHALAQIEDWEELAARLLREERVSRRLERLEERGRDRLHGRGGPWSWMADLQQDVVFGLRVLFRNRLLTTLALLTLVLGIGTTTAVFTFVEASLLRELPYPQPNDIVVVWETPESGRRQPPPYSRMRQWRHNADSFSALAGLVDQSVNLTGNGEPQRVRGGFVSDSFFEVFGLRPLYGRTFQTGDEVDGAEPVVILNHAIWKNRYGADPAVLGKRLTLNGRPFTVVGVMPEDFDLPLNDVDVWLTFQQLPDAFGYAWWNLGRLRPEVSRSRAEAELQGTLAELRQAEAEDAGPLTIQLEPLHDVLVAGHRQSLGLLVAAGLLLLLIACANVANLLLARGLARGREIALRTALGAGRVRVVRQLLTETVILVAAGTALGLVLAWWEVATFSSLFSEMLNKQQAWLHGGVLAFVAALAIGVSLTCGLLPAAHATRINLSGALQTGGRSGGQRRRSRLLGHGLVVVQMAVAVTLLAGAGLLMRSLWNLSHLDPGFESGGLLTLEYRLPSSRYPSGEQQWAFHEAALANLRAIPGVESAALVRRIPFSGNRSYNSFQAPAGTPVEDRRLRTAFINTVSDRAFETLGISLLRGRDFAESDSAGPAAVIVNDMLAERFWPDADPLGQTIRFDDDGFEATVIGIAPTIRYVSITDNPIPQIYLYAGLVPDIFTSVAIRTAGDPISLGSRVQQAIWAVDPEQPMWKIRTVDSLMAGQLERRRAVMAVLAAMASTALLLAGVGLYGVIAQAVRRRNREIGVRMALGASGGQIRRMILLLGLRLGLSGVALGLLGAWFARGLIGEMLFGVTSEDPLTLALVIGLLLAVVVAACFIPARRATRVDPIEALVTE